MSSPPVSALSRSHIGGQDKEPIYATSLFNSDVPIITTREPGSCRALAIDLTADDEESSATIVAGSNSATIVAGSSSAETSDLTSAHVFTLFPKLPTEIRLKIWKLARPGPRFIMIVRDGYHPGMGDQVEQLVWHAKCSSLSPALLFTCRESRAETLKIYKPLLCSVKHDEAVNLRTIPYRRRRGFESANWNIMPRTNRYMSVGKALRANQDLIYCDFGRDVVCMPDGNHNFLTQITEEDRNRTAYVAIPGLRLSIGTLSIDILRLPRLEELMIGLNTHYLPPAPKGLDREMDRVWKLCEGFHDELDFKTQRPDWNRGVDDIISGHRDMYPEGRGLIARPGYFVTHKNETLMSWKKMFGQEWSPE